MGKQIWPHMLDLMLNFSKCENDWLWFQVLKWKAISSVVAAFGWIKEKIEIAC